MTTFNSGWYLIYTKPRHEKMVHSHLKEIKINSYLPTQKVLRTWHDRKKYVEEPLFPSYIFIYLIDLKSYYGGLEAQGALNYVRIGKEIARVSETIVNNIKLVADRVSELEVTDNHLQPGKQLVISEGVLTGLACEVVQINGKQKALVRVSLLQRNLLITLPSGCLAVQ
jgi:transcriptional antiterminator RfaH